MTEDECQVCHGDGWIRTRSDIGLITAWRVEPCLNPNCVAGKEARHKYVLWSQDLWGDDDLLNLHGSLSGGGRKRRKFKKTVIPQGIEVQIDEDDDKLTKYYDAEITDEITDTTIEEILGG